MGIEQKIFDIDAALMFVGDDKTLLGEIIGMFFDDLPDMLQELKKGLTDQDSGTVERIAHSLKGELKTIGAVYSSRIAAELEQRGRDNNLDGAVDLLESFRGEIDRFRMEVKDAI